MIDYKAEWEDNQDPMEPPAPRKSSGKGSRYVPIRIGKMHQIMHEVCGFEQVDPGSMKGTKEHVYERKVIDRKGSDFFCTIRVYSSVDIRTSCTRECARDAIRIVIINEAGYPIRRDGKSREARIYRTEGALDRLYKRCREVFAWVMENACPECRHTLSEFTVKKEGPNKGRRFLTCSDRDCKHFEWID